ncbi:Heme exporter protein C [Gammaproteobacteria bacterium]|nr:heme ABC transporter permease [Gammaproteobacteria bacterium]CAG0944931.1 Heme exporter protein C [Gammaproteobacteria bacterium]
MHRLASPPHFYRLAGVLRRWLLWPALACIAAGAYGGLVLAPPDYQQGEGFRIIYVHVPSAYLSMLIYVVMAVASAIALVWRIKLAHAVAASAAPIGASFTFLALVTGAVWGQPMWGTWWVWDARLTSELILLFLYLGYILLRSAFDDLGKADRASAVLALVGVVNIPIIHYSVIWWSTLHQGPTISKFDNPSITMDMLWPLLVMICGFTLFFLAVLTRRLQGEVLEREQQARWAREIIAGSAAG